MACFSPESPRNPPFPFPFHGAVPFRLRCHLACLAPPLSRRTSDERILTDIYSCPQIRLPTSYIPCHSTRSVGRRNKGAPKFEPISGFLRAFPSATLGIVQLGANRKIGDAHCVNEEPHIDSIASPSQAEPSQNTCRTPEVTAMTM
jgi:hypothetical protein